MEKNNFDLIRFVFAFTVLLRHLIELTEENRITCLQNYFDSYTSVTGFFIISGYLITKSYKRTNSLPSYLQKRFRRILPAYILFVFLASIFLSLLSNLSLSSYFTNRQLYFYFLSNLFFLNFLQPTLPGVFVSNPQPAVNGALWTIKVELLFYLSLPVLLYYIDRCKSYNRIIILAFLYWLSLIYKYYLSNSGNDFLLFLSRQTPGFYCYFVCGISFYYYRNFYLKKIRTYLLILSISIFSMEYFMNIEVLRPICFTVILIYVAYNFPVFNNFGKYGDFSYGIYIYHFPIIQVFIHYNMLKENKLYPGMALLIFTVLIVAILSWNFIEKPWLKRKTN
ncbi:acyltransferase [Spirosoma sp. BT702]|uniref:Acyltransferase n=1 Tax=Spirosoma profusum TaxID=2771354 RepID=A0A926XWD6_9BACT|nr:acyltransferase [Spirosoma profusum]